MEMLLLSSALIALMLIIWGLMQLNERLQRLEANKHKIKTPEEPVAKEPLTRPLPSADDLFQGLESEALFVAMAGEGDSISFADDARKRYELITRKHILGVMDEVASGGYTLASERAIRTLRGAYTSWLPVEFLSTLSDLATGLAADSSNAEVKAQLQRHIEALYARLSFDPPKSFLETDEAVQHGDGESGDPDSAATTSSVSKAPE